MTQWINTPRAHRTLGPEEAAPRLLWSIASGWCLCAAVKSTSLPWGIMSKKKKGGRNSIRDTSIHIHYIKWGEIAGGSLVSRVTNVTAGISQLSGLQDCCVSFPLMTSGWKDKMKEVTCGEVGYAESNSNLREFCSVLSDWNCKNVHHRAREGIFHGIFSMLFVSVCNPQVVKLHGNSVFVLFCFVFISVNK